MPKKFAMERQNLFSAHDSLYSGLQMDEIQ